MDPVQNPYAPGAGRTPAALVGRDSELERWRIALDRIEAGRTAQPLVFYGLRGVGKTVLLNRFFHVARERSWIVAQVEEGTGKSLRETLGEALHAPLADLARPSAGRRLLKGLKTALSFKASYDTSGTWNFGLDLTETAGGGADTGAFETDLNKLAQDLSEAAQDEHAGLAILIDEAQDLNADELAAVCSVAHVAGHRDWRCLFGLAGLPSLPRVLAEAKSYAERLFSFDQIERLDRQLARQALIEPAALEGVGWDHDAVTFLVEETSGYPYFLQQLGQEAWKRRRGPPSPLPMHESVQPAAEPTSTPVFSAPAGTERRPPRSGTYARWPLTVIPAARRAKLPRGSVAASTVSARFAQI